MKKRILSALLALSLALPLPAMAAEEKTVYPPEIEASQKAYETVIDELTSRDGYRVLGETDLCTVCLYYWGTPRGGHPYLYLVYKTGAPLGEGTKVSLPLRDYGMLPDEPDTFSISGGGTVLTYSYMHPTGDMEVYTVDLATGETVRTSVPPTQEEIISWYLNQGGEGYATLEKRLEAPDCSVILFWSEALGKRETFVRSYSLLLIYREPEKREPEERVKKLILPSTVYRDIYYPTDRAPNELSLNEDGSVLTYVYYFDEALYDLGGKQLHDAGTYTYRVNTATGELTVEHTPLPAGPAFADVPADSWFAPYVEVCVEAGLMNGVGGGQFAPERTLTAEECSVLALRLYDLVRGGDGTFEKAPEDFGMLSIAIENGLTLSGVIAPGSRVEGWPLEGEKTWELGNFQKITSPCMAILVTDEEREDLLEKGLYWGKATATYRGVEYPGQMCSALTSPHLLFSPDDGAAFYDGVSGDQWFAAPPDAWYRDAFYYAYLLHQEVENGINGYTLVRGSGQATRWDFAEKLSSAVEGLPAINQITWVPAESWQDFDLLPLYNAGILTGVDAYGSFFPEGFLTRAEGAAMLARVLEPSLRVHFSPAPIPAEGLLVPAEWYGAEYRLIPTALTEEEMKPLLQDPTLPPLIAGEYDYVSYVNDGHFLARRAEGEVTRWFYLDEAGELIRELPSVAAGSQNDWWSYREGTPHPWQDEETGLYGYVDADLQWVIKPQWTYAGPFSRGRAEVHRDFWDEETNQMTWEGNLIDREGDPLLEWGKYSGFSGPYDDPEYEGPTRYHFYDQLHGYSSRAGWIDPETGEEFFFPEGAEPNLLTSEHFKNGYLNGYNRYYGLDLTPVTQTFDFIWDVDTAGGGYVRWGEDIYRIQFTKGPSTET